MPLGLGFWMEGLTVSWWFLVWLVSLVGAFRQVLADFPLCGSLSRSKKWQKTLRGAMGCLPHARLDESSPAPTSRNGDERNLTRPREVGVRQKAPGLFGLTFLVCQSR